MRQYVIVSLSSLELMGVGGSWPELSSHAPFRPLCERRKFLHDNMVEIPNRIMFSEMKQVSVREDPTSAAPNGLKAGQTPLGPNVTERMSYIMGAADVHMLSPRLHLGGQGMKPRWAPCVSKPQHLGRVPALQTLCFVYSSQGVST